MKLCLHHNDLYNHQSPALFFSVPLLLPVAEIANISSPILVNLHQYTSDYFFRNSVAGSTLCCIQNLLLLLVLFAFFCFSFVLNQLATCLHLAKLTF